MASVYALHRPNGEYRYIGVTKKLPYKRMQEHQSAARTGKILPVNCWMRKHSDVVMTVIDTCDTYKEAQKEEIYLIAYWRMELGRVEEPGGLLNLTDGGEGVSGLTYSEEFRLGAAERAKGNTAHLGFINTEESKARMSAAHMGVKHTAERNAHKSEYTRGRILGPMKEETKQKIAASKLGKPSMGMHVRWHINRGITKEGCFYCESILDE